MYLSFVPLFGKMSTIDLDNVITTSTYRNQIIGPIVLESTAAFLGLLWIIVYGFIAHRYTHKAAQEGKHQRRHKQIRSESLIGVGFGVVLTVTATLLLLLDLEDKGFHTTYNNGIRRLVPRLIVLIDFAFIAYRCGNYYLRCNQSSVIVNMKSRSCPYQFRSMNAFFAITVINLVVFVACTTVVATAFLFYDDWRPIETYAAPIAIAVAGFASIIDLVIMMFLMIEQNANLCPAVKHACGYNGSRFFVMLGQLFVELLFVGAVSSLLTYTGLTPVHNDPCNDRFFAPADSTAQAYNWSIKYLLIGYMFAVFVFDFVIRLMPAFKCTKAKFYESPQCDRHPAHHARLKPEHQHLVRHHLQRKEESK